MNGFEDALDGLMSVCVDVFGNRTYTLQRTGEHFQGVFDANHEMVALKDGEQVSTRKPIIKAHRKAIPATLTTDDVLVDDTGMEFRVIDQQPDSGFEVLIVLYTVE